MKKLFFLILLIAFSGICFGEEVISQAATLENIRIGVYPKQIRIVFDFDGQAFYSYSTTEGELNVYLLNASPSSRIGNVLKVNDWVIQEIETFSLPQGLLVKIPISYPVPYSFSSLSNPSRLVIDFGRSFTQIKKSAPLAYGADFYSIVKGNGEEYVTSQVLDVKLDKADIFPALAKPPQSLIDKVIKFFTPWAKKKKPGFFKSKVTDIAAQNGALAGINGTYFDVDGQPLGVLMIDGRLISYPISDRTALILTQDKKAYIDNIMMDAYFKVHDVKYSITGLNEPRSSSEDIILYTPDYGELTRTNATGYDLVVENGTITSTRSGNTWIPENGFVISAGALYAENMAQSVKVGDQAEVVLKVIPYSTSFSGKLKHLIGGGPRLLKSGRIYISKYEENFRSDIASGRAARTAVGITSDNHLLFVTVDGKGRSRRGGNGKSVGMSLTELAYFMQSLGAQDALNLDGGGSSTMAVNNYVVNRPCDGSQRRVSNAVLIKP